MSRIFFVLVPLLLLLIAAVVVAVLLAVSARPGTTLTSKVASARRHAVVTSLVASALMAASLLALAWLVITDALSGLDGARVVAVAPLVATATALVVLLAGELTWPRPHGATRTALLHDRSVRSLLHGGWSKAALAAVVALTVVLVATGLLADGSGDSVTRTRADGAAGAGPFPGWVYGLPQLVTLAVCVLLCALTIGAAVRRAAVVTADLDTDLVLRRASAARALRALAAGALLTLGPDLLLAGSAGGRVAEAGPWHALALVAVVAGPLVVVLGLAALLVPVPRLSAARAPARVGA
jgi:hypothetical protein